jgi:hypothetical protein
LDVHAGRQAGITFKLEPLLGGGSGEHRTSGEAHSGQGPLWAESRRHAAVHHDRRSVRRVQEPMT